jgi:Ni,Fe-hydrogenase III component G
MTDKVFTFWRMESHYAAVQYTLAEIQEMMAGHVVDSERVGEDRMPDVVLVQRFVDQVNSWTDSDLSAFVAAEAKRDSETAETTEWQWDEEA